MSWTYVAVVIGLLLFLTELLVQTYLFGVPLSSVKGAKAATPQAQGLGPYAVLALAAFFSWAAWARPSRFREYKARFEGRATVPVILCIAVGPSMIACLWLAHQNPLLGGLAALLFFLAISCYSAHFLRRPPSLAQSSEHRGEA